MSKKAQIEMYFESQLYQAWMPSNPGTIGIGNAILARKTMAGAIVGVTFLCDHYCLGVKDCYAFLENESGYRHIIQRIQETQELVPVEPGYLKKYVLELVAWAKDIGFFPHPDYRFCSGIFKGIPVDEQATFHFGREQDGVPMFINGPNDTPQRIKQILATLQAYEARTGNKTHFMLGPGGVDDEFEALG